MARSASADIPRVAALERLVESERFQFFIGGAIVLNAVVIGLSTYREVTENYATALSVANNVLYGVFLVELLLRIASYGTRPWNFFRSGWNVFDFIVIGAVLVPAVRNQATVLRLLRLARVIRLIRFLPDARVLIVTITRATPAVLSMVVLTLLIIFTYGVVGWSMFGAALPERWGTIGAAMLSLFILLTLEGFPELLAEAQAVTPWAPLFFLSYVLIAAFVVFNLLIGIVINSMDQARQEEIAQRASATDGDPMEALSARLREVQRMLEELQGELAAVGRRRDGEDPPTGG